MTAARMEAQPRLSVQDAEAALERGWGLRGALSPLPSERDQNFLVRGAEDRRYVLRIANAAESPAEQECQAMVLERLHAAATPFAFPRVVRTREGAVALEVKGPDGTPHHVRLAGYLDGIPLARVLPRSPALAGEVGAMMGAVARALDGFDHAGAHRELRWDLRRAMAVIERYRSAIPDPRKRALLERFLPMFEAYAPRFDALRTGVIHGDANDWNVIVHAADPSDPDRPARVTGLVDFGDVVHSWVAADPAIAAAYAMLDRSDPLATARALVGRYHAVMTLTGEEIAAFFPLICLRLCASVVLSARARVERPGNPYLFVSETSAWALLGRLGRIPPRFAESALRHACGLAPCPETERVVSWLRENAEQLHPVLDGAGPGDAHVLDLSPGSLQFETPPPPGDARARIDAIARTLHDVGTRFGVGRHDEPRLSAEALPADGSEEWPSVHLGVDLFVAAGRLVHAPLDGTVEPASHAGTLVLRHDVSDALHFRSLYRGLSVAPLRPGDSVSRGQPIGTAGEVGAHGGAAHVHVQLAVVALDDLPAMVRPSEREVWTALCPDANLILGLPVETTPRATAPGALLSTRRQMIGPSLSIGYRQPLNIVRGWRQYLYDASGQPYLDAVNNVAHVGHEHARVVDALKRQAGVLNTNTRYLHENLVRYAERLTATLPEPLRVCFFVCSGSEANELALRLARAHTGRRDVLVLDGAYHGNTTSLIEISPYKFAGPGGQGRAPHVHVAPTPDPYRGPHRGDDTGRRYALAVRDLAAAAAERDGIAAFFAEPLPGCAGQIVPPPGFLAEAFDHVRAAGGVCVADEVQTGLGRVGTHFWAFQAEGARPDIVTIGKPIGNGHPLGAVVTTPEIAASFANGMEYFNTFGGNPVSCAVGLAVLDVLQDERLQDNARTVGERLLQGLKSLMAAHTLVGDVRGRGLFLGVELVLDRETREPAGPHASYITERLRERGILLSTDGPYHNVLKIKPPMVFSDADADRLVSTLDSILSEDAVRLD